MKVVKFFGTAIGVMLLSAAVSICTVHYYDTHYATKVVTINASGFMAKIKERILNQKIDGNAIDRELVKLDNLIKAQPDNTLVLLSDVVVSKNVKALQP